MNQLTIQWQCNDASIPRIYHHTPPTNLLFGLREALAEIAEEGLENLWRRHAENSARLHAGLKALGMKLYVSDSSDRLPTVTTFHIPEGIDWKLVTQYANNKYVIWVGPAPKGLAGFPSIWFWEISGDHNKFLLSKAGIISYYSW